MTDYLKTYDKNKGDFLKIGKRIIDRTYLNIIKEYPGRIGKLIQNEINNSNNLLENKLINK